MLGSPRFSPSRRHDAINARGIAGCAGHHNFASTQGNCRWVLLRRPQSGAAIIPRTARSPIRCALLPAQADRPLPPRHGARHRVCSPAVPPCLTVMGVGTGTGAGDAPLPRPAATAASHGTVGTPTWAPGLDVVHDAPPAGHWHRSSRRRGGYRSDSSGDRSSTLRSRGRLRSRHHRSCHSYGTVGSTVTSTSALSRPSPGHAAQPEQSLPPGLQLAQWQDAPWQGQWCQWAPWPQLPVHAATRSVARASQAPSASPSRRGGETGRTQAGGPAPRFRPWHCPSFASLSAEPARSPVLDDAIAAPPPTVPPEDFKVHQDFLKRVASKLQAEEMEGPSDSLFNILSSSAPGRVALPLHQGVASISNTLWQTPASLAPISKKWKGSTFVPTKDHAYADPP
ncbi:uncharacterized protein RBU57_006908 [Macrochelys suwanniensis]